MSDNGPRKYVRDVNYHKKPKKGKAIRRIIGVIVIFAILFLLFKGCQLGFSFFSAYDPDSKEQITVDIPANTGAAEVGNILEKEGVIRDAKVFKYYVKFKGVGGDFKAGRHTLSPAMNLRQIVEELQRGGRATGGEVVALTFPEGITIEDMADIVESNTKYTEKDFMKVVTDKEFIQSMAEKYPELLKSAVEAQNVRYTLEGYLFPATYDFEQSKGLKSLVESMIAKRNETMKPYFAEIAQSNFSVQQILTMASLVEKEALTEADRKKVASVFYNRLKKDMPLQTDISVLYAKKEQKEVVTHNDLEYDSLYNLYKYKGLGPGPFNNPSEGSVVAAIEPDDTNYLYFYADINTGKVFFTDDFEQHIAWQKEFEETGTVKE